MRLAGRAAVVTGAAGHGIGRAVAQAFVREGARVATVDIRPCSGEDGVLALRADVSEPAQLEGALREAGETIGPVDVLVNAAGVTHRKPFLELTLAEWDEVHGVDLRPYFVATQWVARTLVAAGRGGSVINIASINGRAATTSGQAHYCAAKGGVLTLTRAAALELAPHGIRVNSISPGTIETDLNRHLLAGAEFRKLRTDPIPLGRIGDPHEIAPTAVLLASEEGSFITGADIVIDGGQTAASTP